MWSHYAEYHKGFVLEFRIPVMGDSRDLLLATDRLLPHPVTYQVNRPIIDIGHYTQEELFSKSLLMKSSDWCYEEEERVIDKKRPPGVFNYSRDEILSSVIAGMKMPQKSLLVLKELCDKLADSSLPSLKLYRAEASTATYALHVPDHPRLASQAKV